MNLSCEGAVLETEDLLKRGPKNGNLHWYDSVQERFSQRFQVGHRMLSHDGVLVVDSMKVVQEAAADLGGIL